MLPCPLRRISLCCLFAALLSALIPGPKAPGQSADEKAVKAVHAECGLGVRPPVPVFPQGQVTRK